MPHRAWSAIVSILLVGAAPSSVPELTGAAPAWIQHFGSPATDWANRVIETDDGRIVVAGFINRDDNAERPDWNSIVEGYDAQGRRSWGFSGGGPGVDAFWSVLRRTDGLYVLGGISAEPTTGDLDAALTIMDERGRTHIERRFGGRGDDRATDAMELADGSLLLVGQTDSSGAGGIDVFLVKTAADGRELWRRTYGGSSDDRGFFGLPMADGGAVIAGVTGPRGSYDMLLIRIAADGSVMWRRQIGGGANDATHGLAALAGGRILLAGYGSSWAGRGNDISVLTFDPDGTLLSHQAIGAAGDDRVQFAATDGRGGAWLTGYTKSFSNEWRALVARVSVDGRVEPWLGTIGGTGAMNGSAVATGRNGDLLLSGYSSISSLGKAPPDAFVMRVPPSAIEQRRDGVDVRKVETRCHSSEAGGLVCR